MNFKDLLADLKSEELDELINSVDESKANDISSRPKSRLPNDSFYTKNHYKYFTKDSLKALNIDILKKQMASSFTANDYTGYFNSQSEIVQYHITNEDYEEALEEEVKLFIIRLNPFCDNLALHEPINEVNIRNIENLIDICGTDNIEEVLYQCFDELEFNELWINKKDCLNYLLKALKTSDIDNLNCEVEKIYLNR